MDLTTTPQRDQTGKAHPPFPNGAHPPGPKAFGDRPGAAPPREQRGLLLRHAGGETAARGAGPGGRRPVRSAPAQPPHLGRPAAWRSLT